MCVASKVYSLAFAMYSPDSRTIHSGWFQECGHRLKTVLAGQMLIWNDFGHDVIFHRLFGKSSSIRTVLRPVYASHFD